VIIHRGYENRAYKQKVLQEICPFVPVQKFELQFKEHLYSFDHEDVSVQLPYILKDLQKLKRVFSARLYVKVYVAVSEPEGVLIFISLLINLVWFEEGVLNFFCHFFIVVKLEKVCKRCHRKLLELSNPDLWERVSKNISIF
jgi:hypothetical protein